MIRTLDTVDGTIFLTTGEVRKELPEALAQKILDQCSAALNHPFGPPQNLSLPFFAYGLFKPSQLGFKALKPFLIEACVQAQVFGSLYERDGIPLFDASEGSPEEKVSGAILKFSPDMEGKAYSLIGDIEPSKQYKWGTAKTVDGLMCNLLIGVKSKKGSEHVEGGDWDGSKDPLFVEALALVKATSEEAAKYPGSVDSLLKLQMAYMLLWTSIERYVSLRYGLRGEIWPKLKSLAAEPGFKAALNQTVTKADSVFSTDNLKPKKLDKSDSEASIDYYYQLRCNISHRGKAVMTDGIKLQRSIGELTAIFTKILNDEFRCML